MAGDKRVRAAKTKNKRGPCGRDASQSGKRQRSKTVLVGVGPDQAPQLRAARPDRFDEEKQAAFFADLTETCNVTGAAKSAGVCVQTVYNKRRRDPDFARRWDQAKGDAVADLEMRALAQGRFGREVVVEQRATEDGQVLTRRTRHDEASLTLQRIGRSGLVRIGSEDAEREAEAMAERQARVEAAVQLLSQGVREILGADRHG